MVNKGPVIIHVCFFSTFVGILSLRTVFDSNQVFYIGTCVESGGRVGMGSVYKVDILVCKSGGGGVCQYG